LRGAFDAIAPAAVNYLAHVFLSHQTPDAIVGAMLGDFAKGRLAEPWNEAVREAVRLHRAIDRYTDRHPLVQASRACISPARRRFAGVLVDIFYDHFLARHWSRYHGLPLTEFTRGVYAALLPHRAAFPPRLQRALPWMVRDDWLAAYANVSAVDAALHGLARRFRYPERAQPLRDGVAELQRNYGALEAHFLDFFPQLQAYVASQRAAETRAAPR